LLFSVRPKIFKSFQKKIFSPKVLEFDVVLIKIGFIIKKTKKLIRGRKGLKTYATPHDQFIIGKKINPGKRSFLPVFSNFVYTLHYNTIFLVH
jgi:hypothetical protein